MEALELLNSLPSEAPFASDVRFDDKNLFVCEAMGDWARRFQQLKSSLTFKDRGDLNRSSVVESSNGGRHANAASDSQMAFWNSTTSMMNALLEEPQLFDRESFEKQFQLVWTAPPVPRGDGG